MKVGGAPACAQAWSVAAMAASRASTIASARMAMTSGREANASPLARGLFCTTRARYSAAGARAARTLAPSCRARYDSLTP